MKILILDDDGDFRRDHIQRIKANSAIATAVAFDEITPPAFRDLLKVVESRRTAARQGKIKRFERDCILDDTTVLIVDYDLLTLEDTGFMTGENVAYLARCYTKCGFILGLNQHGENPFDLTLKGHPESFADLNIGSKQLHNRGLWCNRWSGFRPWSWPLVLDAAQRLERRVNEVAQHMDEPIFSWLEIPEPIVKLLPRSVTQFITRSATPDATTFKEFVLGSDNGLRGRRDQTSEECMVRIAAARVSKWLERLVLAGQDILVDAPHLVSRYPSLIKASKLTTKTLTQTASLDKVDTLGIHHERIAPALFKKPNWISRPAWFWPSISQLQTIREVVEPWTAKQPDLAFCEDISRFKPKGECHEFVADLPSPFARRWAAKVANVDYTPEVRFSL